MFDVTNSNIKHYSNNEIILFHGPQLPTPQPLSLFGNSECVTNTHISSGYMAISNQGSMTQRQQLPDPRRVLESGQPPPL